MKHSVYPRPGSWSRSVARFCKYEHQAIFAIHPGEILLDELAELGVTPTELSPARSTSRPIA